MSGDSAKSLSDAIDSFGKLALAVGDENNERARRIGYAIGALSTIIGIAEDQESEGIRGGFTILREARRALKVLETGSEE